MSWIKTIGVDEADAELEGLYERAKDPKTGKLDHILQVHSLNPAGLAAHLELYNTVMRGSKTLRKVERELLAFVVSQAKWIPPRRCGHMA